ncbi:MAG TPA: hypothetical protein DEQ34_06875 [Balneolaceae bacterium]|nr:hypothetical protein [Balneolaceae bacterium]|tara:strand:+ start:3661 stop:4062 length:402 start_codon:yes stop_codon:yes gene_type:complete
MEVQGIGPNQSSERHESDIFSVSDSKDGLTILIDTVDETGIRRDLKIHFKFTYAYRYLDEGDLAYYWATDAFRDNKHVFRIFSGGWSNGETLENGILTISSVTEIPEWFIATTNGCLNVLSYNEPEIQYLPNA